MAWSETGSGAKWNALGPGRLDSTWVHDVLVVKRVCRELGRYQLNPCIDWVKRLGDSSCTRANLRTDYAIGVRCGMENLSYLLTKYNNRVTVVQRQNGGGPMADAYVLKTLAYLGWLQLTHPEVLQ